MKIFIIKLLCQVQNNMQNEILNVNWLAMNFQWQNVN